MKLWAKDIPGRNSHCDSPCVAQVRKRDLIFSESPVERSGDTRLSKLTIVLGTTEAYFVKYLNIPSKACVCIVNSNS